MSIPPELIAAAKADLERLKREAAVAQLNEADLDLMRRYPRHTLAAARMIDATTPGGAVYETPAHVCKGFDFLLWQERGKK